ncbi:TetR/AcrR family transcriptional regulator [Anaeromicropila populeti]|uniref:Transcriptional regulator, TetR family n=1 Tax=Anaeromicropila populeti TaxID=37658 RepID=A0A1I6IPR1_9FIRM|nr:TetR/AcrR family transcriptional regulator [Anaeromicropila populeti]SFR68230.1 transcriptional regulator, TetR family [Anaeromicropila populeti]
MELKEQIIEATIEEFNEKGLKFTMDQLAKRMGISKKTLYSVFSDKESLFLEAIDTCFSEIKRSEKEIFEDDKLDTMEKIRKIIIVLPKRYQAIDFRQLYQLEEKFPKMFRKIEARLETDWEPTIQLIEQAIREGKIRRIEIPVLQTMISSTIEAFIKTNVLIKNDISYTNALEEMICIILDGIRVKSSET